MTSFFLHTNSALTLKIDDIHDVTFFKDLLADYDNDSSDDEDDEDRGEWLFQLQNVRGMNQ